MIHTQKQKKNQERDKDKSKLDPMDKPKNDGKKNEDPKKKRTHSNKELLQFLWQIANRHPKIMIRVGLLLFLNIIFTLALPLIFQHVLSLIEQSGLHNTAPIMSKILPWLILYFLIVIVNWISIVFRRKNTIFMNSHIIRDMRLNVFNDLLTNNLNFYHNAESGKLVSTITNDIQEMSDTGERFIIIVINLSRLIITIGILLYFSWKLTLASIVFLPVFFVIFWALRNYRRNAEKNWRKSFGDVNQSFSESMRSIAVCKTFAQEEESIRNFTEKNERTYIASIRRAFGIFIVGPFGDLFKHVLLVIVLILGMWILQQPDPKLSISAFYLFVLMIDYYYYPILNLVYNMSRFQSLFGVLDRLFAYCKVPANQEKAAEGQKLVNLKGKLEFKHVDFAYTSDAPVLNDISFTLNPGERLALVGHTGVGKTTVASLMMRFYEINQGQILLDDQDINTYSLETLRDEIGLVNQRVLLIKGTIRENLLLAKSDATDEDIWTILDAVQAREFIEALPDGLDTIISGNGKNLSAGQRQMISFARVLLGNPKFIILDEATSSVDLYTEARIQYSTDLLLEGRTSIVIAHRLTTILKSDKIVVMENGKVVQVGTHQELVKAPGPYQEMYDLYFRTQSAKYLETIKV